MAESTKSGIFLLDELNTCQVAEVVAQRRWHESLSGTRQRPGRVMEH